MHDGTGVVLIPEEIHLFIHSLICSFRSRLLDTFHCQAMSTPHFKSPSERPHWGIFAPMVQLGTLELREAEGDVLAHKDSQRFFPNLVFIFHRSPSPSAENLDSSEDFKVMMIQPLLTFLASPLNS